MFGQNKMKCASPCQMWGGLISHPWWGVRRPCLSVTRPYSDETAEHIVKRTHTILVFHTKCHDSISTGAPNVGDESKGYEKSRFSTNNSLYLRNFSRFGYSYYGMRLRIGNFTQTFENGYIQWQTNSKW